MAATPNGTSTAAGSTSTSVAPSTPAGSVAGDLLVFMLYIELNSPAVLSPQNALINAGGGIDASQTTIVYDTGSNLPTAGEVQIDNEVIQYTGGGGAASGTLTGCTRGAYGTTAATHADNARMSSWIRLKDTLQTGPSTYDYREIVFWKHVGAAEPGTQSFTFTNAYREACIQRVTGAPVTGNPIAASSAVANASQNLEPVAPTLTTTVADQLVLVFYVTAAGGNATWGPGSALINDGDGITAGDTSIVYDTAVSLPVAGDIIIDSEKISYTGGGGSASGTLTGCTRGLDGTTAATHADNAVITGLLTERIDSVSMAEYSFVKVVAAATGSKYVRCTGGPNPEWHCGTMLAVVSAALLVKKADETVQVADGRVRTLTLRRIRNETENLVEGILGQRRMVRLRNEAENVSEGAIRSRLMSRIRSEVENISEGTTRTRLMARVRSETVNVTEGTVKLVAAFLVRVISETVNVTEGVLRHRLLARIRGETVNATETVGRAISLVRTRNEASDISETRLGQRRMTRLRNETVNLGEGTVKIVQAFLVKIVADIVNIVEGRVRTITMRRIRGETENVSETSGRTRSMVRIIAETEQLQEGTIRSRLMVRLRNEVTNIVEGVTKVLGAVLLKPPLVFLDAEYEPRIDLSATYEPVIDLAADYEEGP